MDGSALRGGRKVKVESVLRADEITHRFGGLIALERVSVEVRPNLVTAMIGPNGAGKTTMFNIMSGVISPVSGRVSVRGVDVTGWPTHRIANLGLARTWQDSQAFDNLTVLENVVVGRALRRTTGFLDSLLFLPRHTADLRQAQSRADSLLALVGIWEKRLAFPKELSYGQRKRLEIARALATDPQIVMLDEPTSGLRTKEVGEMAALVRRLSEMGSSVFLIEHNMNVVTTIADHVIVLNFGKKIAEGEPTRVLSAPEVIEAYLGTRRPTVARGAKEPADKN